MRGIAWICWVAWSGLVACGGAVTPASGPEARLRPARGGGIESDVAPVDPIAALTPPDDRDDRTELSWAVPQQLRLELGGAVIAAAGAGRPIEVVVIERQGNLVRAAVRLEHVRFSVWIERASLLAVLKRDHRLALGGGPAASRDTEVVLRAGAAVTRLAHRDRKTQVRYFGAVQVEGWVPDAVLGERGRARDGTGRIPTGRKTLMVVPGAVIRSEPRWAAGALATMANGYFLDTIRVIDDAWTEVGYEDGDVSVHGFVSRRDPPGRLHRWRETDGTPTVVANATVASGTCLHARVDGEPVGYVVGNRPVELEDVGDGNWMISIDTPWGPLGFAARGASRTELVACAPPGAVPPATPLPAAPTP